MARSTIKFIEEKNQIINFIESRSQTMSEYIKCNNLSRYTLWYKTLMHSDLTNRGKRNGKKEGLDKNLLYYLSQEEMESIEDANQKPFESAKQSNIGLTDAFYKDIDMPRLQRRIGPQATQHNHLLLNDYADVYIVNETVEYFKTEYTNRIFEVLNKKVKWKPQNNIKLSQNDFTPIQLTQAIHGLGTAEDVDFHKLRLSMFCNDMFILLIEHCEPKKKLYILLEKNPRFFTLAGITNKAWENYLITKRSQEDSLISSQNTLFVEEEKTRAKQSAWKNLLAQEMMNYTTHEGEVFCPLTQISAEFDAVPMLFIASHIKRYVDSDSNEAYDINNGLLLCANADALFDKHMITINENKELVFSFLVDNNWQLKQKLLLNQPIFKIVLNSARMEYMKEHRELFYQKEKQRKNA